HDIKKMITERMAFVDSRSETLIQTVDILASFLRRLLAREIIGDGIARSLGRLQIFRRHDDGQLQSVHVMTISLTPGPPTALLRTVRATTAAGRSMIKPERPFGRPALRTRGGAAQRRRPVRGLPHKSAGR